MGGRGVETSEETCRRPGLQRWRWVCERPRTTLESLQQAARALPGLPLRAAFFSVALCVVLTFRLSICVPSRL